MYDMMTEAAQPQRQAWGETAARADDPVPMNPRLLARMLDVVDYGMLIVVDEARVVYANQVARAELDHEHPLQLLGRELRPRSPRDLAALRQALLNALRRGAQAMVTMRGAAGGSVSVSIVPLLDDGAAPAALLVFGKRRACEELSTDAFAREHGLTSAETRVLKHLCAGQRPADVARMGGVKLSTVRTQISRIRDKTGSPDIGGVVGQVSRLPPMLCLVRRAA